MQFESEMMNDISRFAWNETALSLMQALISTRTACGLRWHLGAGSVSRASLLVPGTSRRRPQGQERARVLYAHALSHRAFNVHKHTVLAWNGWNERRRIKEGARRRVRAQFQTTFIRSVVAVSAAVVTLFSVFVLFFSNCLLLSRCSFVRRAIRTIEWIPR